MTPCFGKGMRLMARRLRLGSGFGLGLLLRQDPLELLLDSTLDMVAEPGPEYGKKKKK